MSRSLVRRARYGNVFMPNLRQKPVFQAGPGCSLQAGGVAAEAISPHAGGQPCHVLAACCFVHARPKFFGLVDVAAAARRKNQDDRASVIYPNAIETVYRLAVRQELSAPLTGELQVWATSQFAKPSDNHDFAKPIDFELHRWDAFIRFLDYEPICSSAMPLNAFFVVFLFGPKAWLLCGSECGGKSAAIAYSQIKTSRRNDVDPQARLPNTLALTAGLPSKSSMNS